MDYYTYHDEFFVTEKYQNALREVEKSRLIRLAKAHNDALGERSDLSLRGLANAAVLWAERTVDSGRERLSDARAWWAQSRRPQEQGC